jgi:hypothetical protein
MKIVRLFNIRWDTDEEDPNKLGLPTQHIAVVDDDWDAEEEAADLLSDTYGFCVEGCSYETLDNPTGEKSDLWGSETWEEIGSVLQPCEVARYDLDAPYHPDKANADWAVTAISVMMVGPDHLAFFDQNGGHLNPDAVSWGRVPTLDEILTYLRETE